MPATTDRANALAAVYAALQASDASDHAQVFRDLIEIGLLGFAFERGLEAGAELAYELGDGLATAGGGQ